MAFQQLVEMQSGLQDYCVFAITHNGFGAVIYLFAVKCSLKMCGILTLSRDTIVSWAFFFNFLFSWTITWQRTIRQFYTMESCIRHLSNALLTDQWYVEVLSLAEHVSMHIKSSISRAGSDQYLRARDIQDAHYAREKSKIAPSAERCMRHIHAKHEACLMHFWILEDMRHQENGVLESSIVMLALQVATHASTHARTSAAKHTHSLLDTHARTHARTHAHPHPHMGQSTHWDACISGFYLT